MGRVVSSAETRPASSPPGDGRLGGRELRGSDALPASSMPRAVEERALRRRRAGRSQSTRAPPRPRIPVGNPCPAPRPRPRLAAERLPQPPPGNAARPERRVELRDGSNSLRGEAPPQPPSKPPFPVAHKGLNSAGTRCRRDAAPGSRAASQARSLLRWAVVFLTKLLPVPMRKKKERKKKGYRGSAPLSLTESAALLEAKPGMRGTEAALRAVAL